MLDLTTLWKPEREQSLNETLANQVGPRQSFNAFDKHDESTRDGPRDRFHACDRVASRVAPAGPGSADDALALHPDTMPEDAGMTMVNATVIEVGMTRATVAAEATIITGRS